MLGTVRRFISLSYGQLRMPYLAGVGPRLPAQRKRKREGIFFSRNRRDYGDNLPACISQENIPLRSLAKSSPFPRSHGDE